MTFSSNDLYMVKISTFHIITARIFTMSQKGLLTLVLKGTMQICRFENLTICSCSCKNNTHISRAHISKRKRYFNMKSSTYYFQMKMKITAYFQICISVPLNCMIFFKSFMILMKVAKQKTTINNKIRTMDFLFPFFLLGRTS